MTTNEDRFPYLTATTLDQAFLDQCHDSLTNQLELVVDIESPDGSTIHASDRNKYVGGTFYEALLNFPVMRRTAGEWLSTALEFSTLELQLSNVDGRFNSVLPGGADYDTWIGKTVEVKIGLRNVAATYTTVFRGKVTNDGGIGRDVRSIRLIARDDADRADVQFPQNSFLRDDFPDIEDEVNGRGVPVIYGDWTTAVNPRGASVPATLVNGRNPFVHFQEQTVTIAVGSPAVFAAARHRFENDDAAQLATDGSLPSPFGAGTTYYVVNATEHTFQLANVPGGAAINAVGAQSGTHRVLPAAGSVREALQLWIAGHALESFDTTQVYLFRGSAWTLVPVSEILFVAGDNTWFTVGQETGTTWVDGEQYTFQRGDQFYVKCKGYNLGAYSNNLVSIAMHLMQTYGGVDSGDFDASWATLRDKSTPAESAIVTFKGRHWQQEGASVLEVAKSLLSQVRLTPYVDRDLEWALLADHFDEFDSAPSFTIKNWDVVRNSFKPTLDTRQPSFNVAKGVYNRLPDLGENAYETPIFKNPVAITAAGKEIGKQLIFPNLYELQTVEYQVKENLKLASAYFETIDVELTWRSLLLDIGDWVSVDVQIQSTQYDGVPLVIREIGYDPNGPKIIVKGWSTQMVPFPGWNPGYSGITGGSSAVIEQET